jgi:hypothetical protein
MTRREVAKRLGKSVAAVRRLEGVHLHPARDSRGVHHFDEDEVEALAERVSSGEFSIWREIAVDFERDSPPPSGCRHCSARENQLAGLRQQLERQRRTYAQELVAVRSERDRERAQNATERRQLDRELRDLIATIESS